MDVNIFTFIVLLMYGNLKLLFTYKALRVLYEICGRTLCPKSQSNPDQSIAAASFPHAANPDPSKMFFSQQLPPCQGPRGEHPSRGHPQGTASPRLSERQVLEELCLLALLCCWPSHQHTSGLEGFPTLLSPFSPAYLEFGVVPPNCSPVQFT